MKKLLASLPALTALLLACSSSSSGGGGGSSSSGGASSSGAASSSGGASSSGSSSGALGSSCGQYSACSLITASAVGQAFGTTFSAGTEHDTNTTPSATEAEEVACDFAGTGGWTATVTVRCCPCADNDEQTDESEAQSLGETTTPVTGVGDEAFWAAPGADAGLLSNAYTLNVLKGADLYILVNVLTPSGTAPPLTGATSVAQTVLGAL